MSRRKEKTETIKRHLHHVLETGEPILLATIVVYLSELVTLPETSVFIDIAEIVSSNDEYIVTENQSKLYIRDMTNIPNIALPTKPLKG